MIKVGSGTLKGRKLFTPPGVVTRPTSARLKKSLFDILAPHLHRASVLDLFSGAGALGIEAISRGAEHAVFVERDRRAVAVLHRNLEELAIQGRADVRAMEVVSFLRRSREKPGERFDIIFLDPPYRDPIEPLAVALVRAEILRPHSILAWEHHKARDPASHLPSLEPMRSVRASDSVLTLFRAPGPEMVT